MNKALVYAKHNKAGIAPKKVAIMMDLVRGEPLINAKKRLAFDPTKAAKIILKVVRSAETNAKNNHNLDPKNLFISEIYVNQGKVQKWGHPTARGKFSPQLRRTSHIIVGLSPKEEEKTEEKKHKSLLRRKK